MQFMNRLLTGGIVLLQALALNTASAQDLCSGQGQLATLLHADWENGLDGWDASSRDIANPATFDSTDWAVVSNLPAGRGGMAAFVENVDLGDCGPDDESGVLILESPPIAIGGDIDVPRVIVDHWYETEYGWDGGNFKISVNGGPFNLIPASAIEQGTYDDDLFPAFDEFGLIYNTNPLADEPAYTGTPGGAGGGIWVETRISLLDLASAGDTIRLRLEFGVDCSSGEVGWYVDDLRVYGCEAEQLPSDCGNRVIDAGEQCDDGNDLSGDGCSNTCQIESGWTCTAPGAAANIDDPGFEDGTPNPAWDEVSDNAFGTPICSQPVCGTGGGSGASVGDYWAWFGGVLSGHAGSLTQDVIIPEGVDELLFDLEIPACDSGSDYFEILIDDQQVFYVDGSSPACGVNGYNTRSANISAWADGNGHTLQLHAETFANSGGASNFFVDALTMPGAASQCTQEGATQLTLKKAVVNNNGGTAGPAAWTLTATGPTAFSGNGPSVSSPGGFEAGTYDLSESGGPPGYASSDWDCDGGTQIGGDTIALESGESATCTITNDDMAPALTLIKQVINDDGGQAAPSDWALQASGPTGFSGPGPSVSSGPNFRAGTYDLNEGGGPAGYVASAWDCSGGAQLDHNSVTIGLAENVSCTITNNDVPGGFSVNAGHAGAWFNPDTSGQGIFVDVEPGEQFMFISWFTYTAENSASPNEQRWLTAQGNYTGNLAELTLYETLGGRFDDPQDVQNVAIGEVDILFGDCEQGEMAYRIDAEALEGAFPLYRVIAGSGDTCASLSGNSTQAVDINPGMDGAWFEPETSGQGFFIDAFPDGEGGGFIFVSWFTYGDDTASGLRWLTAQGNFEGSLAQIEVNETTGGSFDDPLAPETVPVGTMSIDFTDCSNATLNYDLTDDGLSGEIALSRVVAGSEALCEQMTAAQ